MLRVISKCQHAHELLVTLDNEFLSKSKSQLLHVKNLIQSTKKNNISINEYLKKMKEYVEILLSSGHSIIDDEVFNHTLDSLDFEYDSAVITLNSRIGCRYDKSSL